MKRTSLWNATALALVLTTLGAVTPTTQGAAAPTPLPSLEATPWGAVTGDLQCALQLDSVKQPIMSVGLSVRNLGSSKVVITVGDFGRASEYLVVTDNSVMRDHGWVSGSGADPRRKELIDPGKSVMWHYYRPIGDLAAGRTYLIAFDGPLQSSAGATTVPMRCGPLLYKTPAK